jgi:hypothetical protein
MTITTLDIAIEAVHKANEQYDHDNIAAAWFELRRMRAEMFLNDPNYSDHASWARKELAELDRLEGRAS